MHIVAWVVKLIAIQMMLMGIHIAAQANCNPYVYLVMLGSIFFSVGGNILYLNERHKNKKSK